MAWGDESVSGVGRGAWLAGLALCTVTCVGDWEPVNPGGPPPGDDDDSTEVEEQAWTPVLLPGPALNPDAGWVATNPNQSWESLAARAGGEPLRLASVIYTRLDSATWAFPNDGSSPGALGVGNAAALVAEGIDHERYVGFRVYADDPEDLPEAWILTLDPAGLVPDGRISLVQVGEEPVGDDDDSAAGDDDDSAAGGDDDDSVAGGDDDDSAAGGDDDDSAAGGDDDDSSVGDDDDSAASGGDGDLELEPGAIYAPNYADPDYREAHAAQIVALGERFASEVGLAFVDIGGVGEQGGWDFSDPSLWFEGAPPIFSPVSWGAEILFYVDVYRAAFPDVPLYIPYTALLHAGDAADDVLQALRQEGVHIRDDCLGGCSEPDFDRFPDEGSSNPYPPDDPYGGWLPATLHEEQAIQYEGRLGGLGSWRLDDARGDWDEASFGPFDTYFRRMLDVRIHYAPPSLVSLSGTACTSEWVHAAEPPGSACAPQTPGEIWEPLLTYGEQLGYRYVVTELRGRPDWEAVDSLEVELDVLNTGVLASPADRSVELAFVSLETGEAAEVVTLPADVPTSAWLPGEPVTLSASLSTAELSFEQDDAWALTLRVVEPRAFGGGIALPHPSVGTEARHVLATWPATAD